MPSSVIGALRVSLGLDSATFNSGATAAEKRAYQMGDRIGKAIRSPIAAIGSLKGAIGTLAGALAVKELGAAALRGLEYASSLGEVSQQLGVTSKDLQEYRYAATQVGISQEEMDKGLAKLTVTMGQARAGVSGPKAAFKELSDLLGQDLLKNAATAGDAIPLIADALAKVPDPAKRAALEVALFGRTGQRLDTLLAGGSKAVNQLRDAAQSLGLVLSDEQIQSADATADKLTELKTVLEANIAGAVANNAQSILSLAEAFAALVVSAGKAVEAVRNFSNLQGYKNGDIGSGQQLAKTASGRATLLGEIDSQIAQNQRDRASGRGNRTSSFGGLIQTTTRADTASNARSDAEYQRLNKRRNAVLHLDAAASRVRVPGRAGSIGAGAGTSDADTSSAARKATSDAKRIAGEQKRAAAKAAEDERRYQHDLSRSRDDQLNAQLDLTVDQTERVNIQQALLDNENAYRLEDIASNKDLTDEQKRQLTIIETETGALRVRLLHRQDQEILAKEALDRAQAEGDNKTDILNAQAGLARTTKERAALELQILDIQFKQLKLAQQQIIDSQSSSPQEKDLARQRIGTLNQLQGYAVAKSKKDNQGPLSSYLDSIPKSAAEVNEALEGIEANGLSSLIDGLSKVEGGFKGLASTVENVANEIISSLIKIGLQKGVAALFGSLLGGGTVNAYTSGGDASSAGSGIGTIFAGARAKGGSVTAGKMYLVGERGPEPFIPNTSGTIIPNDALGGGRGGDVYQNITIPGGVDLMTRTEGYRVAGAVKDATIAALADRDRRRG